MYQPGLARLLPSTLGLKRWSCAVLKAFYDTGNKLDSRRYKTVTLACVHGIAKTFTGFEKTWWAVMRKHQAGYLHATDALTLEGDFTDKKGWNSKRVSDLITECVSVIECAVQGGLALGTCTLVLSDYKAAKERLFDLAEPEHLVAADCLGKTICFHRLRFPEDDGRISLFFDRDDPFHGHIRNLWNRRDLRKTDTWSSIKQISQVSMAETPPVQVADLIAWSVNAAWRRGELNHDWQLRLHETVQWRTVMDAHYFKQNRIARNVEAFKALKLPRRKEMR